MKVVVLASRKGGSGKTTLAGHLSVEAERAGNGPVALIDIDPQGSLADWWNKRAALAPHFVQTTLSSLSDDMARLTDMGVELLIVDTPPALDESVRTMVGHADLVVIPTRPSPHDLRSIGATVELAEELGKPQVFVVNGATPRARITNEIVTILSQHGMLAPVIVHQRVDFAASMIDGRTVMELSGETRSGDEIARLWSYLQHRLSGTALRRIMPAPPPRAAQPELFAVAGGGGKA